MRRTLVLTVVVGLGAAGLAGAAHAGRAPGLHLVRVESISGPAPLPVGCDPVADENTAQLAVDPSDASHLVASYTVGAGVAQVLAVSTDGGRHWHRQLAGDLTGCGHSAGQGIDPDLVVGADGTTWLTQGWLGFGSTAAEHDAVREFTSTAAPGKPLSAPTDIDTSAPLQRGWILTDPAAPGTAYLETERADYLAANYAPGWPVGGVTVRRSTDGGRTWTQTGLVTGVTGAAPGHAMLAGALERSGDAMVAIVHDVFLPTAAAGVAAGSDGLAGDAVAYRSDDGGVTWTPAGILGTESACCLLDSAAAPDGTLYGTWAEPTADGQDLVLARSTDGGRSWVRTIAAHRVGAAGVQVAVGRDGDVAVFWYSTGDDPARPSDLTPVAAVSRDGGQTWSPPVALAASFDPADITTFNDTGPLGPYQDLAALPHGFAAAFTVGGAGVTAGGTSDVVLAVLAGRR
jgi:hypothetical protein